ncbi:MAG: hypothetical protein IKR94_02005 [Bacteroidales bacterium]|nr:hypothetical protein [Bacteroidales bacterium]
MNELAIFKNIPVTADEIATAYPKIKFGNKKVAELENQGRIYRLKKGLYVVNPKENGILLSTELIGNRIYGPSYVSSLTALRYYGLIPEYVHTVQSMTTHLSKVFNNQVGRFEYYHCTKEYYHIGIEYVTENNISFMIASPEKALCDYIVTTPHLQLRYLKETANFLEYDLRFDTDRYRDMDTSILKQCAAVSKKRDSINNIIKIIEHEQFI